jgi:hypothetical protein
VNSWSRSSSSRRRSSEISGAANAIDRSARSPRDATSRGYR